MGKSDLADEVERHIHSGRFKIYMTAWSALFAILFGFAFLSGIGRFAHDTFAPASKPAVIGALERAEPMRLSPAGKPAP